MWMAANGMGSALFHITQKYGMQLWDEMSMLFLISHIFFCICKWSTRGAVVSLGVPTLTSVAYILSGNPLMHQIVFGLIAGACGIEGLRRMVPKKEPIANIKPVKYDAIFHAALSGLFLVSGFAIWNIDKHCCPQLRYARKHYLRPSLGFLTQFHAWWHVLTLIACIYAVRAIKEHYEENESSGTDNVENEEADEHAILRPNRN